MPNLSKSALRPLLSAHVAIQLKTVDAPMRRRVRQNKVARSLFVLGSIVGLARNLSAPPIRQS